MSQPFHDSASELLGLVAPALRLNPSAVSTVARCLEATATLAVKAERAALAAAEARAEERDELYAAAVEERDQARDWNRLLGAQYLNDCAERAKTLIAAEASLSAMRDALGETVRRASLPITPAVNGMPDSPETLAAAIAKCCRLAIDHVVEPARRALAPDAHREGKP